MPIFSYKWQTFSVKDQIVNTLGFVGYMLSLSPPFLSNNLLKCKNSS